MSQDNTDDLFPSGFDTKPYEAGDRDYGLPIFPEAVWLAQMTMMGMDDGSDLGLAYRLMWGSVPDEGEPTLDGELWLASHQMAGLMEHYAAMAATEQEGD